MPSPRTEGPIVMPDVEGVAVERGKWNSIYKDGCTWFNPEHTTVGRPDEVEYTLLVTILKEIWRYSFDQKHFKAVYCAGEKTFTVEYTKRSLVG